MRGTSNGWCTTSGRRDDVATLRSRWDDMTDTTSLPPKASTTCAFDVFVKCPLCGSSEYKLLFAHKEIGNVVRCTQCKLKFTRSRWTASMPELRQEHPEPLSDMYLQKQESQIDDFLDILTRIKGYQANG